MESASLCPGGRFGRYQIVTRLATGGMAEIWLAEIASVGGFQKQVVLKTMLPHLAESADFVEMFIQEASLAARLNHPNIIDIFDLGELDGTYFIAMEYIQGRTLRQIQKRLRQLESPMPVAFLLKALSSVCDGLQYAHDFGLSDDHSLGVIHRDLSPENIMLTFTGTTKILDFGISKTIASGKSSTNPGTLKGKFTYMSPETARAQPVDRRSDIYALGVMIYELLTGSAPFTATDDVGILARITEGRPKNPCEVSPHVSPELAKIILTAMALDRDARYAEADDLKTEILAYLRSHHDSELQSSLASDLSVWFSDAKEVPRSLQRQRTPSRATPQSAPSCAVKLSIEPPLDALAVVQEIGTDFDFEIVLDEPPAKSQVLARIVERLAAANRAAEPEAHFDGALTIVATSLADRPLESESRGVDPFAPKRARHRVTGPDAFSSARKSKGDRLKDLLGDRTVDSHSRATSVERSLSHQLTSERTYGNEK